MTKSFLLAFLLGACALSPCTAGQQTEPTVLHVSAHLVEVPVTVLDGHGRYVDGIERGEFKIVENGKPQVIKYFESSTESLSCAILLDTTGSMEAALPRLKNSVMRLIEELGPDDSVMIYSFAESLIIQQDLTKDKSAAKRSVVRLRAGGGTALYDALSETSQEFGKKPGKKAIIVFTDGDDNTSVLTAQAAARSAMKNGVPVFSIAEGEATQSPRLEKMLQDLSRSTGGETYVIKDLKDMDEVFQRISAAVRHIYLLSYPPPLEPADGRWRNIEVTIESAKQYRIRAKEGYFPN